MVDGFVMGAISAAILFWFVYGPLKRNTKRWVNKYLGSGALDIGVTIGSLFIVGTAASSLATALGIGVGTGLSVRAGVFLFGTKYIPRSKQREFKK